MYMVHLLRCLDSTDPTGRSPISCMQCIRVKKSIRLLLDITQKTFKKDFFFQREIIQQFVVCPFYDGCQIGDGSLSLVRQIDPGHPSVSRIGFTPYPAGGNHAVQDPCQSGRIQRDTPTDFPDGKPVLFPKGFHKQTLHRGQPESLEIPFQDALGSLVGFSKQKNYIFAKRYHIIFYLAYKIKSLLINVNNKLNYRLSFSKA